MKKETYGKVNSSEVIFTGSGKLIFIRIIN